MSRARASAAFATLLVVTCVMLTGCGVGAQSEPDTIGRDEVPFDLLSQAPPSGPTARQSGQSEFVVYLVGPGTLVPATRGHSSSPTLAEVLRSLMSGPTDAEAALGLHSAIPQGSELRGIQVRNGIATISLGGAFAEVRDRARIVAFAQLVLTVTDRPAVSSARFELDGRRIDVPMLDGRLTAEPVGRDDYTLSPVTLERATSR